jgi:hypothetical protein
MLTLWSTRDINLLSIGFAHSHKNIWYNTGASDIAQTYRLILVGRLSLTSDNLRY